MAKTFKTLLSEQIPKRLQTKEFNVLLNLVKKRSIKTREQLIDYIKKREDGLRKWLKTFKRGSVMRVRKQKTSELKFISFIKNKFFKYLK